MIFHSPVTSGHAPHPGPCIASVDTIGLSFTIIGRSFTIIPWGRLHPLRMRPVGIRRSFGPSLRRGGHKVHGVAEGELWVFDSAYPVEGQLAPSSHR